MMVVEKFPTLRDVENDNWARNNNPLPDENSEYYLAVVAARLVHTIPEFPCLDTTSIKPVIMDIVIFLLGEFGCNFYLHISKELIELFRIAILTFEKEARSEEL